MSGQKVERRIRPALTGALATSPVVAITGARTAASRFGALLETFVVTEVLKQAGWASELVSAYHYRTADGVEVDLVLETADGRVAAIEVKAGSQVPGSAMRGLTQLRDRLGPRFVAGLLLTSGSQAQHVADRLSVAPVDTLWTP